MELGIFAKTFPRPSLEQTLDAVAAHGLTCVQFNMSCMGLATLPDKLDEGSCVWIAQTLHERGLSMAAISGTFNMVDPNGSRLANNLRRLEVLAEACRWLDTRIITLCTGSLDAHDMWKWHPENARKSTWERLVETMRAAVAVADRHEVTLAFEPEINNVVSSVIKARRLLDEINSRWLKVVIDPANLLRPGDMGRLIEILDEAFDWIGRDIVLAHAKKPQVNEADRRSLDEMKERALRTRHREFILALMEAATPDARVSRFGGFAKGIPRKKLLEELSFHFYFSYLVRLSIIGYRGAIVMHGLDEEEVDLRSALLRDTLKLIVPEGPIHADPDS
jgi:sugar phosphate isomerase/epimerase